MFIGIFILSLLLLFAAAVMVSFTMILHGGFSVGAILQKKMQPSILGFLLFACPFLTWIPIVLLVKHVQEAHSIIYLYCNLLITVVACEVSYSLRGEHKLNKVSQWLNVFSGALIIAWLFGYHAQFD